MITLSLYTPAPQTNPSQYKAYKSSSIKNQSTIPTSTLPDELLCLDTESLSAHAHAHRLLISQGITALSPLFKIHANIRKNTAETDKLRDPLIIQLK